MFLCCCPLHLTIDLSRVCVQQVRDFNRQESWVWSQIKQACIISFTIYMQAFMVQVSQTGRNPVRRAGSQEESAATIWRDNNNTCNALCRKSLWICRAVGPPTGLDLSSGMETKDWCCGWYLQSHYCSRIRFGGWNVCVQKLHDDTHGMSHRASWHMSRKLQALKVQKLLQESKRHVHKIFAVETQVWVTNSTTSDLVLANAFLIETHSVHICCIIDQACTCGT